MATIRQRGKYSWEVQVRRRGFPTQTRTFDTEADARKWGRKIERECDQGLYLDRTTAEDLTLGDVLTRFRDEVVPHHKGAEVETLRINALLRNSMCQVAMIALTPAMLATWRDERLKEVSSSTVRRELDIISAAINVARKDWDVTVQNPVLMMRRPSPARARDRRLTGDEEVRLLDALESDGHDEKGRFLPGTRNPHIKPIVQLMIETAMRRGEILAMRWEHVDLDARTVFLPDTKNGDARTVPLSPKALEVLQSLPWQATGTVFPITENAFKKAFNRARQSAGIENLRAHDLRHEATSRLAMHLDNILELSAVTGHRDVRMLKRYYHPNASDLAQKLADRMAASSKGPKQS